MESGLTMRAAPGTIYRLAAAVERWPDLLPHYRSVRVLEERGDRRLVEMAASRDGIPVRWWAEQTLYPTEPRIIFHHVRGPTRGMNVEWSFTPRPDGTYVAIRHELALGWPLVGELVADRIIGRFFVDNIAGKTLRRIKALAEAET
jgi:ribosome-associated toxin RatA of RatAB toxin-antitoxin module